MISSSIEMTAAPERFGTFEHRQSVSFGFQDIAQRLAQGPVIFDEGDVQHGIMTLNITFPDYAPCSAAYDLV